MVFSSNAWAYRPRPSPSSHRAMSSAIEPLPRRRAFEAKLYVLPVEESIDAKLRAWLKNEAKSLRLPESVVIGKRPWRPLLRSSGAGTKRTSPRRDMTSAAVSQSLFSAATM